MYKICNHPLDPFGEIDLLLQDRNTTCTTTTTTTTTSTTNTTATNTINTNTNPQECWRRVQFVSHAIFCECLSASCSLVLRNSILKAYAIQKCSQLELGGGEGALLYDCEAVCDFRVSTHPRLHNNWKIISFKAQLKKQTLREAKSVILVDDLKTHDTPISKYSRLIYSTNSYLRKKFPHLSCNDLSDTKFVSRSLEILFEHYLLTINPQKNEYTVQYLRPDRATLEYLEETCTLEANYRGLEGKVYVNPIVIVMRNHLSEIPKRRRFIGMASFLDSNDLKVKTNYLEYNTTTDADPDDGRLMHYEERLILYQRLCTKSLYSKSQPFVIELSRKKKKLNKIDGDGTASISKKGKSHRLTAIDYYFETCWRTNARLSQKIVDLYVRLPPNYRPIHHPNITEKDVFDLIVGDGSSADIGHRPGSSVVLPKLDGILATLIFYETHFVVTHSFKSESFVHNLSAKIYYLLKDLVFLVESNLGEVDLGGVDLGGVDLGGVDLGGVDLGEVNGARGFGPRTAMAIIDLQSGHVFDPIQRYHILQKIKENIAVYSQLLKYNIFINSESLLQELNPVRKKNAAIDHWDWDETSDQDGKTSNQCMPVENLNDGEIYEVLINPFTYKVTKVIKARPDKAIPNSGILVKTVCQSLRNHHTSSRKSENMNCERGIRYPNRKFTKKINRLNRNYPNSKRKRS